MHFANKHDGCRLVNNIFYYPTSVPNAAVAIAWPDKDIRLRSDYNLFGPMVDRTHVAYVYRASVLDLVVRGPTLKQWQQASGQDAHSLQADRSCPARRGRSTRLTTPRRNAIGANCTASRTVCCTTTRCKDIRSCRSRLQRRRVRR